VYIGAGRAASNNREAALKQVRGLLAGAALVASAWAQSGTQQTGRQQYEQHRKDKPGPGHEIGGGAADVGKGAAKGAGDAGKGVAKGAGDLVTLHPIDAGVAVGRGAGSAGKDVVVGTAKGSGKIVRGVGRAFKKIL
jgi:hypothetical protein